MGTLQERGIFMLRRIALMGAGALALANVVMAPGIAAAKPVTGNVSCTLSGKAVITPGLPLQLSPAVQAKKTYKTAVTFNGTFKECTGQQQNINTKKGFGPIDHGTVAAKGKTKYAKGMDLPTCIGLTAPTVPTVFKATTIFMDAKNNIVAKSVATLTVGSATLGPPVSFPSSGPVSGGAFKGATATTVTNLTNDGGVAGACGVPGDNMGTPPSTTFEFTDDTSTLEIK
jgi:hypothetical protein